MSEPTYQRTQLWRPVRRRMHGALAVGAVTCFVAMIAVVPAHSAFTSSSTGPGDIARVTVMKLANQDFPAWRVHHAGCPHRLADLAPDAALDPWGHALRYTCDPRLAGGDAFAVRSAGPDGRFGTSDDVSSR